MKNHSILIKRFYVSCSSISVRKFSAMVACCLMLLGVSRFGLQAQAPVRLTDIFSGSTSSTIANLYADPSGKYLYFTAKPTAADQEWYRITVADNSLTKISSDFSDYASGTIMRTTFRVKDNVFFAGAKGFNGANPDLEFNRFDLTNQTFQYVNINPNGISSDPNGGFVEDANGDVLFLATAASGTQIYRWNKSDNTVTSFNNQAVTNSWYPSQNAGIAYSNGYLYFESYLSNTGCPSACLVTNNEPVRYKLSDNTYRTWELSPGTTGSSVRSIKVYSGNKIAFDARTSSNGPRQVFIMDPLVAEDAPLQLTNFAGTISDGDIGGYMDDNNGKLYYFADNVDTQRELYVIDLANKTNTKLTNFATNNSIVAPMFMYGNFLYFSWRIGSNAGLKKIDRITNVITDVLTGFTSSLTNFTVVGGTAFFQGPTPTYGTELWQLNIADGTSFRLTDINAGSLGSAPGRPVFFPGKIYFTASEASTGSELYTMAVNATLPLSLISFDGKITQHAAKLQWQTASEINTSLFEIEYSSDASRFATIGKIKAAGSGGRHYAFTHSLIAPKNYYRLKMIDKDGKFTHSDVILLLDQDLTSKLKIFPNPVSTDLTIQAIRGTVSDLKYTIFGSTGLLLLEGTIQNGATKIPVSRLSPGQYTIQLSNGQSGNFVKK